MGIASRLAHAKQEVLEAAEAYRRAEGTAYLPARANLEVRLNEFERMVRRATVLDATEAVEELTPEEGDEDADPGS